MADLPIWLLDVDGVLNGFGRCGWRAAPRTSHAHAEGRGWRMRWAPQLAERITAIHTSGLVEIRWATTWIDHGTDQIAHLMGLPLGMPHAYVRADHEVHCESKLRAALEVISAGRRLVWTDDAAIPQDGPARETLEEAGALLIAPDDRAALRPEDLDAIEAYLKEGP